MKTLPIVKTGNEELEKCFQTDGKSPQDAGV